VIDVKAGFYVDAMLGRSQSRHASAERHNTHLPARLYSQRSACPAKRDMMVKNLEAALAETGRFGAPMAVVRLAGDRGRRSIEKES
jgi:hypothetical protein